MVLTIRRLRRVSIFVLTLLAVEFLDEFIYGTREAAWPLIRADYNLSYAQIGLLLGVPNIIASFIEPVLGILADIGHRRRLILGGGILFGIAALLTAVSQDFSLLMLATILFYPSSGAFVSLSQTALMDSDPTRHEHNMARWTFAGSLGVVVAPLALSAALAFGGGWRDLYLLTAAASFVLVIVCQRYLRAQYAALHDEAEDQPTPGFVEGVREAVAALRRREVLRWLTLLQFSDLLMDVLHGYLALYFVDVVGVDEGQGALAVLVWTLVGLVGDLLLIPLLERMRGLTYLRISAVLELVLFVAFLLVPGLIPKLVILALLGFFNAGWYAILAAQLYSAMPGRSGTVLTVSNVFGLVGGMTPALIGVIAGIVGLDTALWLLTLGPIALLIGLPRHELLTEELLDD